MPFNPQGLSTDDIESIKAMYDQFSSSLIGGDYDALVSVYTETAVFMPPHSPPLIGKDEIKAWFKARPICTKIDFMVDEIVGENDLAFVRGRYRMMLEIPEAPEPVEDIGSYLEIRERQVEGHWLLARDIFNTSLEVQN